MMDNKTVNDLERAYPFIKSMKRQKELFNVINKVEVSPGTVLMEEGDICYNVVLILSGILRVYKWSPQGKEITLYRIKRGETCILSVSSVLNDGVYPAFAEVEEEAVLLTIPAAYFKNLMIHEHVWQKFSFNVISSKLNQVMVLVEEITFKSMHERVAEFLCEKIEKNNSKKFLRLTHDEIAKELGTAREVVSRLLKEFEKKELISLYRGKIEVIEIEKLRKISSM